MSTLSLLLIEDDEIDQMAFKFLVEKEQLGYDYWIASSITEAQALLRQREFDIIVSDYKLGDGTAIDVLAFQNDAPVIVVTSTGSESLAVAVMKAGAYDYLTKDLQRNYLSLLPIVVENAVRRRNAEREAREMMRERVRREALQNFINDASHDLRTPLTTFSTSLYLLTRNAQRLSSFASEPATDIKSIQEIATSIEERCFVLSEQKDRLERIILDMLEMVRIDNLNRLDMVTMDINCLISTIIETQRPLTALKGLELVFEPLSRPAIVMANSDELENVFRQLLKNAILYTPEDGKIKISISTQRDEVVISFSDTGVGIAPDSLPHIFERFYRVDKARGSAAQSGSGLGLSIAKQIVELHNGRIEVESIVQQGSTFHVYLPLRFT